jgi:prepilin-type processing-associated H-X9-DG protein
VSDDATDIIYRVSVGDTFFTAIEAWCSTNPEPWDLAWDGTNIWSITGPGGGFDPVMGEREIYKHDAAGNIIEIWHYPGADGPPPGSYGGFGTGLAFAGNQLWYCDVDRDEIIEGIRGAGIGWIAFGSSRDGDLDIWAVRPDGSGLRQLTNMPGAEFTPQWSPDSTKIAYATATDAQIWVYDWFTGTNTKIFDGDDYGGMYYAAEPAWSPDGRRILFQGQTTYNNPHIAVINADGSGRRIIVPVEGGYVSGPSWCPSGTAFVYDRRNSGASFSPDLWIYDFTATGDITNGVNHRLTDGAGSESTTKFNSDWTPSGKIVFCWGHNLVLIDPGRSPNWNGPISDPLDPHVTFLTNDASYPSIRYSYPSWSPDLSQIVYADESAATGTYDLWIIDAQPGGNRHPVMTTPYGESYPDWGNPTPEPQPPPVYHVDAVNGNDNNNGLSRRTAFATISKGIDSATNRYKVLVYPGVYQEEVDFKGKAITIQGVATKAGIPIIENPGDFAVSFYNGEGPCSILKNFVVRNSFMAIFIAGSSPTLKNLNIIDNKYGIEAYAGSEPDISNCILWNNSDSDLFGCEARYSCTSEPGQGNISADPCFVDPNNSDYHLLSQRGRYWPRADVWVLDKVTSPCIDGGDPDDDVLDEPMPNGGLINMGAYGGTPYASMSEWELKGDINRDGKVNMIDFSIFAEYWLVSSLRAREIDNQLACSHNLMALGRAMMFYANDYEDEFPKADQWCDLLLQYKDGHVTEEMFVCPSAEGGPSHYAINPNAKSMSSEPYMVLLFETTAGWNQFGGPELLAPENHQGRGCNILFVDGHVEFVESERLDELRWERK